MNHSEKLNTELFTNYFDTDIEKGIISRISLLDKPETIIGITEDNKYHFKIYYLNNDEPKIYKNENLGVSYQIGLNSKRIYEISINNIEQANKIVKTIKSDIEEITKNYKPLLYSKALYETFKKSIKKFQNLLPA